MASTCSQGARPGGDAVSAHQTDNGFAAYEAKQSRFDKVWEQILPHNKAVLFDALASAGIECVILEFDGYGDDGQFQGTTAYHAGVEHGLKEGTDVPVVSVILKSVVFDTGEVEEKSVLLASAIEEMVSDFLEDTHDGWEDGEGAFGHFRLSVPDRSITLEYNERYIESKFEEHSF